MSFDDFWDRHYHNKDKSGYLYKHLKFAWSYQQQVIDSLIEDNKAMGDRMSEVGIALGGLASDCKSEDFGQAVFDSRGAHQYKEV